MYATGCTATLFENYADDRSVTRSIVAANGWGM